MSAFSLVELQGGQGQLLSKHGHECSYIGGRFDFGRGPINIGGDNKGGLAGFVGENDKFFLYCGRKFAEIAIARLNAKTNTWEYHKSWQWMSEKNADNAFFEEIWSTQNNLALLFVPKDEHRRPIMKHGKNGEKRYCIKIDLAKATVRRLTEKEFSDNKQYKIAKDSCQPTSDCSPAEHSSETLSSVSVTHALVSKEVVKTIIQTAELCATLEKALVALSKDLQYKGRRP